MSTIDQDQIKQFVKSSASDPTAADDSTLGYTRGQRWLNTTTERVWVLVRETPGAAVWRQDTPEPGAADLDKVITAFATGVASSNYAHDVPLVVIDNLGNLVTRL